MELKTVSLIIYKFLAGLLIFIISLVTVIYPIRARIYPSHHHFLELGDAFASGIFLGAALFHMLPSASESFSQLLPAIHYPLAEVICAMGFLLLLFLERLSHYRSVKKIQPYSQEEVPTSLPYMLAVILVIHSLIEGTVLGVNTTFTTASIIFVAILAHKSSESFALAIVLNRSRLSLKTIIWTILIFSLMTPLGIGAGSLFASRFQEGNLLTAEFNAFAAGTFLYMSTLHHINHHHRINEAESLLEYVFLAIGLVLMGVIAFWA